MGCLRDPVAGRSRDVRRTSVKHEVILQYSSKKVQSTTGKKKVKQIFQTKKDITTCSKLTINELGHCPTRLDNVYFANNEQAWFAFTAGFCFAHAEYNLIKLKLYIN